MKFQSGEFVKWDNGKGAVRVVTVERQRKGGKTVVNIYLPNHREVGDD